MEKGSSVLKWIVIGGGLIVFFIWGMPALFGGGDSATRQPLGPGYTAAPERAEEQVCELAGNRFNATLSSRGGTLQHFSMVDAKYAEKVEKPETRIDLATPGLNELRRALRTDLRVPEKDLEGQQVPFNDLDFVLEKQDEAGCHFLYKDENVEVRKDIGLTGRAFELSLKMSVKNLSETPRKHRLTVEQNQWRTKKQTSGSFGRLPEYETETVVHTKDHTGRFVASDFTPKEFTTHHFSPEAWRREVGDVVWVSTSSSYFASMVIVTDDKAAWGETRIEDAWDVTKYQKKDDDPESGHVFRSRVAFPQKELEKDAEVTYETLVFMGPKERDVIAGIGGDEQGKKAYKTSELINMSVFIFGNLFTSTLGKVLVGYTYWLHDFFKSWGVAIIFLTITVKLIVFPLGLVGLKSSVGMRRIRPQLDEINKKYKDDMMARNLATQEVMRKEKVGSPMIGCLPALLQMPIWLSLYAALRSSVELYHTPFGPLIPDLSEPGKYYVIPIVLGLSSFLQQWLMMKSMPQADPTQAKIMMFLMPVVFTVMNIFLPAGLGVYMLTNTWLGIIQQFVMERWIQRRLRAEKAATIQVREKASDGSKGDSSDKDDETNAKKAKSSALVSQKKGKARARG